MGGIMKRNLTVVCVLTGLCTALFAGVAAVGFVYGLIAVGVTGCLMAVVSLWYLAGSIQRERLYLRFERRFAAADYAAAVALLDRASHNPIFFPVYRIIVFQLYIRAYLALDDTAQAAKYVDILRHAGGTGWKYRTAFLVIVVNLDWEDIAAAQEEYDAFRKDCAHAQIYREQIGILDAVFAHLAGETPPVPDAAKRSPYPVVHRVIQKYC